MMYKPNRWTRRTSAVTALAAAGTLALSGIAFADNVTNNIDGSVDAVAEVMPLTAGGANGTTKIYVVATQDGIKNGCDLTGSNSVTVSAKSSDQSVATLDKSSLTINGCDASNGQTLTVHPVGQGSATISFTQTATTVGGDVFTTDTAMFTVNVTAPVPTNTAPQVSVTGVVGGTSYAKGSVPSATCSVADAEEGPSSFAATLSAVTGPNALDGIGQQDASCSYTDGGGLTATSSVTYNIVDPSPPVIGSSLDPANPTGDNGWYTGDVALNWNVADAQSPNSLTKSGCVDQNITADQVATDYTCSASSAGGRTGPQTVSIKRDATAPVVSAGDPSGTAGKNGWYTSDVTVPFTAVDATSGPATDTQSVTSSGEGSAVTVTSPVFKDNAGNAADVVTRTFKIDKTAPNAPTAALSPAANGAGWNKDDVSVHFADNGDGANGSGVVGCTADVPVTGETDVNGQTVSGKCTDAAGNVSAATEVTVRIDKTAPATPVFSGGPSGEVFYGSVPAAPTCSATDGLSGFDKCVVTGYSTEVGDHTLTATATDLAGNVSSATQNYQVHWTRKGFYQPVDMGDVWNTVKGGGTVPMKFNVFAGSRELTDPATTVTSFSTKAVACPGTSAPVDAIETVTTGGTSLRYDTTAGQFVQNWQTPKKPGTCAVATITTQDGGKMSANFLFK